MIPARKAAPRAAFAYLEDIMAKLSAHGSEITRLHCYVPIPEDPDFAGEDLYFSPWTDVAGGPCCGGDQ